VVDVTRELYDLTFVAPTGQFGDEVTVAVDLDDAEQVELTLATHLSAAIRRAGGDMSDLDECGIEVRRHGYQAVQFLFQTDTWVED
jgi:hypothetical protein